MGVILPHELLNSLVVICHTSKIQLQSFKPSIGTKTKKSCPGLYCLILGLVGGFDA